MKKQQVILWVLAVFFCTNYCKAQTNPIETILETSRRFTIQGDYTNAILVLNRALENNSESIALKKELAYNLFLTGDPNKAKSILIPLLDQKNMDATGFQIAANIYKALAEPKEIEKVYKKGLKKFPNDGPLNSEYGEFLFAKQDPVNAIKYWEKGISEDPNYPMNYYHAAKYYYFTTEKVKGLIYGEIFINLNSNSPKTTEIKTLLLEGFKKLFAENNMKVNQLCKAPLCEAFLTLMEKQRALTQLGIKADDIAIIRIRFLLDWLDQYQKTIPFHLFQYQQNLLKSGLFEAYHQWIFMAAENPESFQTWLKNNSEPYQRFQEFQRNTLYRITPQNNQNL